MITKTGHEDAIHVHQGDLIAETTSAFWKMQKNKIIYFKGLQKGNPKKKQEGQFAQSPH